VLLTIGQLAEHCSVTVRARDLHRHEWEEESASNSKPRQTTSARVLIPPEVEARPHTLSTSDSVIDFARGIGVAPGIVVGRMQHDGLIPHRQWADLITRYRFADQL
jgi:HTH-type transcriptional regulator / antitoxin HigA